MVEVYFSFEFCILLNVYCMIVCIGNKKFPDVIKLLLNKFSCCRSLNFSVPKQETLSRHSFFGPNGLRGQWSGPCSEIKVVLFSLKVV